MSTCSIVLPKVPPPLHRPPPRPYLPVPACVCPRVPTPTPFPMPSCARCYHGQVEPAGGPRARFVGPAPAQQLPKQPPHGVYCAPHAQIVSTCAIPAAIPAAIRAALPATTLRAPPPEQQPSEQQPPEQQPSEQQPSLQQPSEQQPSEQCQPASPAVKEVCSAYRYHTQYHTTRRHHTPQLATLTILTTLTALATLTVLRTHHSRTHCPCHTRRMLSILIILQFSPFSPFSSGGRQDGAADALGL